MARHLLIALALAAPATGLNLKPQLRKPQNGLVSAPALHNGAVAAAAPKSLLARAAVATTGGEDDSLAETSVAAL